MTLDKARELIEVQLGFGGDYNRNAVRLILGEIQREHGQQAVDRLIGEMNLELAYEPAKGTDFSRAAR
jgi:hypothetical protein